MQDIRSKQFRSMLEAVSRWHAGRREFGVAGVPSPLPGLILATLLFPASSLADSFFARACATQTFQIGGACQQDSSAFGALATQSYTSGAISLQAGTAAGAGYLQALSRATMQNMQDWSSGNITAYTDARINETIDPDWADWAARGYDSMADVELYVFDFQIEVSGTQVATFGGPGAGGAASTVRYTYSVGGNSGSGSRSTFAGENYGTWGTVDASFLIGKGATYTLEMGAHTWASGDKTFVPWSDASIDASADFSHTMKWMGITGIHAFDSAGNEISLPADARLQMIGRESGFDYWYAATAIPEPSSTLLLCSGLMGVAAYARTQSGRRRFSTHAHRATPE